MLRHLEIVCLCPKKNFKDHLELVENIFPNDNNLFCGLYNLVTDCIILQEDLLTFVDVRTLKIKHEEQFKYEVKDIYCSSR